MTIKGKAIIAEATIDKEIFIIATLAISKTITALRGHTGVIRRRPTLVNMYTRVITIDRVEMITIVVNFFIRVNIIIRATTIRLVDMIFAADGSETWRTRLRC